MADYEGNIEAPGSTTTDANTTVTTENLLDKIADSLILDTGLKVDKTILQSNQKTIKNGIISVGRTDTDTLLLYQTDVKANTKDLQSIDSNGLTLEGIVDTFNTNGIFLENVLVHISGVSTENAQIILDCQSSEVGPFDVSTLLFSLDQDGGKNPMNVSQFLSIDTTATSINKLQAEEFLDTNIYELLPGSSIRQERIDNAITELRGLLPPPISQDDFYDDFGRIDRDNETGDWVGSQDYYLNNSISAPQNGEIGAGDEEDGFITRLSENESSLNTGKSIQSLRDELSQYLLDIDEEGISPDDTRQTYRNQSNGYLKFRNLNQGIIIRNTNQDFVEGLNPDTQDYLQTGFTITMWVRFLDKVSEGTLFNFGNPLRDDDTAFGFKLETYVVNKNDPISHNNFNNFGELVDANGYLNNTIGIFNNTDSERFVRLVINDNGVLRDSHTGNPTLSKLEPGNIPAIDGRNSNDYRLLSNRLIPQNYNEWYFICATFNADVKEDESWNDYDYETQYDFWMGNFDPVQEQSTSYSGFGNKCKVEIISRSDLLRARGFKVD